MHQRHKLIIWGPGDMGGRALREALTSPNFDVVGVKVFSPHKDGVDIGTLVGLPPVGISATADKQTILALAADCVIYTPTTPALMKGADDDVIELLASGKNVVSAASYHNASMANWLTESQQPLEILRTLAKMRTTGAVPGPQERQALSRLRRAMRVVDSPLARPVRPLIEALADKAMDRAVPRRRTGERLQNACLSGSVSLHGTGLHPGLMVEQVVLRLAGLQDEVREVGFLEVGDLSTAPDGMWGGLSSLGFGTELSAVDSDHVLALAQHFYFDDVLGNVAYELFGTHSRDVRVERHVYPVPARVEITAGGTVIRPGTVGAIHMTYRGYIGDRLFMTNEECWHVGAGNAHLGPDHPDSLVGGHVVRLDGLPANIEMRVVPEDDAYGGDWSAVTDISVKAMLDIVAAVCAAPPGVVIPDLSPRYQLESM